jgi:hypothetical protein
MFQSLLDASKNRAFRDQLRAHIQHFHVVHMHGHAPHARERLDVHLEHAHGFLDVERPHDEDPIRPAGSDEAAGRIEPRKERRGREGGEDCRWVRGPVRLTCSGKSVSPCHMARRGTDSTGCYSSCGVDATWAPTHVGSRFRSCGAVTRGSRGIPS